MRRYIIFSVVNDGNRVIHAAVDGAKNARAAITAYETFWDKNYKWPIPIPVKAIAQSRMKEHEVVEALWKRHIDEHGKMK